MVSSGVSSLDLLDGLSLTDKIRLLSGAGLWHTEAFEQVGIASMTLTDGPHGLRKQIGSEDRVSFDNSVPATCFPPAVTLGSTWDLDLLVEVGRALGREARAESVDVLLGPGLNLKRHPGGGRNFEYFSEDPLLSGRSAAALVRGIQAEGVAACLKHFVANNQEAWRMRIDTLVDDRTLRELYLTGFEIAVNDGQPWTVMSSYNKVNGCHVGQSRDLLTGILRDEWGFHGMVVSDWLAVADRPASLQAGLDLEMPSSSGAWDGAILAALQAGQLSESDIDTACQRLIDLSRLTTDARAQLGTAAPDFEAHHALARRAAAAGTVLLTNDGILPLREGSTIAVIGSFAEVPRYQGAGSSLITPTRVDTVLDCLRDRWGKDRVSYAPGYDATTGEATGNHLAQAREVAANADVVIVLVGLPTAFESEGFDRMSLQLPQGHNALVDTVLDANVRTIVAVNNGGTVDMPWAERPAALIEAFLGGQAGGAALVDIVCGDVEPGGRLAESIPVSLDDLPAHANFANHPTQVEYRETQYVGYRLHDTFDIAPRFCFGHGLGYTTFAYDGLEISGAGTDLTVQVAVTNTGHRRGSDVVQVYVHDVASTLHRPAQELKGFAKVVLDPGESQRVRVPLNRRSFAVWDVAAHAWLVEEGAFEIRVGASSRDLRCRTTIHIASDDVVTPAVRPRAALATTQEFADLLGRPVPAPAALHPLHLDSSLDDLAATSLGRPLRALLLRAIARRLDVGGDVSRSAFDAVMGQVPLRTIAAGSNGLVSFATLHRVVRIVNATSRRRS